MKKINRNCIIKIDDAAAKTKGKGWDVEKEQYYYVYNDHPHVACVKSKLIPQLFRK